MEIIGYRFHRMKKDILSRLSVFLIISVVLFSGAKAQVGEHRSDLALGLNGGLTLSNVGFLPKVPQTMEMGYTFGMTMRYTCEKYFTSICALQGEINFASIGWKQDIKTLQDEPVINPETGNAEEFDRSMYYIQVPMFARMGWGRERKGGQFYFMAGPQFGFYLSDKINKNYDEPNIYDRTSQVIEQETKSVENKFDYGITAALGFEYSHPKIPHLAIDVRYYYGLGDFYENSKRDYFGRSNFGNIVVKVHCLFDILKTKNSNIK